MKKSKLGPVVIFVITGSAVGVVAATPEYTIFTTAFNEKVTTLLTLIGRFGHAIVVSKGYLTALRVPAAKPIITFFLICFYQLTCAQRAAVMFVHIFRGLAIHIIERSAAIRKPATAPERPHLSLNSTQRFLASRTIMQSLVIAAVVGFGVRFGHSFGQSFGNSLLVAGARNARHSMPLDFNYGSRSNQAAQRFTTLRGRYGYLSCPSSFIAAIRAAFSAAVPIEMRSLSRSRSWSK